MSEHTMNLGTSIRNKKRNREQAALDPQLKKQLLGDSESVQCYELSHDEIDCLTNSKPFTIQRPENSLNFYLVMLDIYQNDATTRSAVNQFETTMNNLNALRDTCRADGILIKANPSLTGAIKRVNALQVYQKILGPNVHAYTQDASILIHNFSNSYETFLMDPLKAQYELHYRLGNPSSIHEGKTFNCGLASVLVTLASYDKFLFARMADSVCVNGSVTLDTSFQLCALEASIERPKASRTMVELLLSALSNTDHYAVKATSKIRNIFAGFLELVSKTMDPKVSAFIHKFCEDKLGNFIANSPKMLVKLLKHFHFEIKSESIQSTLMETLKSQVPEKAKQTIVNDFFSKKHQELSSFDLVSYIKHIEQELEDGNVVLSSLGLKYNFDLMSLSGKKMDMSDDLVKINPGLRPDHMVFTEKMRLNTDNTVDFSFCTFGSKYDVNVSLDEFKQGFRGCIVARK